MESGERESREVAKLLEKELENGIPPQKVIENLQQSIANTDAQTEFLCMYDEKGIQLCHPDPALIGQKIDPANSDFEKNKTSLKIAFSEILRSGKPTTGIRRFPEVKNRSSEIVNVYPVQGSDWMVATHFNIQVLQQQFANLYKQYMLGFLIMALLIIICCFLLIRLIYHKYEKRLTSEIEELNQKVNELSILNKQLVLTQENVVARTPQGEAPTEDENHRKRLVTYEKDEMILLEIQDAALFYLTENNLVIKTFLGKESKINLSLDELMKQLDNHIFYRANRQYIVNVNAIKTIFIYGKNQLRLVTQPDSPEDIIISKNKVAEFKNWLDQ
jgi:sensor histidine kinase regulating citrate/malate metabolism